MAKMTLTIKNATALNKSGAGATYDISMTTGAGASAGTCYLTTDYWTKDEAAQSWGSGKSGKLTFQLTLQYVEFHKQMYAPNSIEAYLLIKPMDDGSTVYKGFPSKDQLNDLFANKVVALDCDDISVCTDYYVHEFFPRKYSDKMYVLLKIYSPDKVMTLSKYCRTFTSKKLGAEIIDDQIGNFSISRGQKSFNSNGTVSSTKVITPLSYDTTNMKHLKSSGGVEHIFPYLVQYNESFYDFLARTTNRWGEFLYYEDKKLHIGYSDTSQDVESYSVMSYLNWNDSRPAEAKPGTYVGDAPYDSNILKSVVKKNGFDAVKNTIAQIADMDNGGDVYLMKKVASVLNNSKSLKNFLIDSSVDDLVALGTSEARVALNNKNFNDAYFEDMKTNHGKLPNHNGAHVSDDTYNEFSEATPIVDEKTYASILEKEVTAGQNMVNIEFDTKYPNLLLGQVIKVDGDNYIVTEVVGYQPEKIIIDQTEKTKAETRSYYEKGYNNDVVRYRVTAVAKDTDGNYYPPVLPTGHVRTSGPQVAVVVDVDDPQRANRVRVKYPWQLKDFIDKKDEGKADDKKIKTFEKLKANDLKEIDASDATPWLLYASSSGPSKAGVHGRHYLAEKVLVDYAGGNVERPYVVGAVSADVPVAIKTGSSVMMAPNGEFIKVHEGLGNGALAFFAGFTPGLKLASSFIPCQIVDSGDASKRLEGGVEMGDKYGIWSIKGSTDGRNVSVSSPWGDVKIDAFTGITITAPNGDVRITGKNVTIAAGNNLTLTSGTNIQNRFISGYGEGKLYNVGSFAADVAKAVTQKLASMLISVVDLSLIRSVIEVFFKPQEGALTVKSNRFLKLEAGGATAGYPDTVYKNPKKRALKDLDKEGTLNMGPAMAELIKKIPNVVNWMFKAYKSQYKECVKLKEDFDSSIEWLQFYSNNGAPYRDTAVCQNFAQLKNKLWNPNTKEIQAGDLAFNGQVKDAGDNVVNDDCRNRISAENGYIRGHIGGHRKFLVLSVKDNKGLNEYICKQRKKYKEKLLKEANALLQAIIKLRTLPLRTDDATYSAMFYGALTKYAPANYVSIFQKAFSKDSLSTSKFYDYAYNLGGAPTDQRADLGALVDGAVPGFAMDDNAKKILARRVALNMVKEWGMGKTAIQHSVNDEGVWQENQLPNEPANLTSDDDFADDARWQAYVESLSITDLTVIKKDRNFVKMLGKDLLSKLAFWTPWTENYSWGNAKAGQILFGTGNTYCMDNGIIQPINARYNKGKIDKAGLFDEGERKIEKMMRPIRSAMLGLLAPVPGEGGDDQVQGNEEEGGDVELQNL